MATTQTPVLYGSPTDPLYAPGMAKRLMLGIQEIRERLRERVDAADEAGEHTVVAKRGKPVAVLVPMQWYRDASAAVNDPTEY